MIRAVRTRILRQVLLVIIGAEAFSCTEISGLSRRGQSTGRLSVDVAVDPPVDQTSVRSEQCPSLTAVHHERQLKGSQINAMFPVYLLKADAADRLDCCKKSQEGLCGKVLAAANWASG
jgi:hypothetical protein